MPSVIPHLEAVATPCLFLDGGTPDICEDSKQVLYIKCAYIHPSGAQCSNPVTQYTDPPFCGAHCDNAIPPEGFLEDGREEGGEAIVEQSHGGEKESKGCLQEQSDVPGLPSDEINPVINLNS